jgi:hypothetical protein
MSIYLLKHNKDYFGYKSKDHKQPSIVFAFSSRKQVDLMAKHVIHNNDPMTAIIWRPPNDYIFKKNILNKKYIDPFNVSIEIADPQEAGMYFSISYVRLCIIEKVLQNHKNLLMKGMFNGVENVFDYDKELTYHYLETLFQQNYSPDTSADSLDSLSQ